MLTSIRNYIWKTTGELIRGESNFKMKFGMLSVDILFLH